MPVLQPFRADFNHVIIKMITRPKIKGCQSWGTLGQDLFSALAVTTEDSNPSLLPKQAEEFCSGCPKTGCPQFLTMLSFQQSNL